MRWEEAVGILHKAMGTGTCTDSDLNKAHILLGAMAYQQGDIEAARRHFGEAHRRDPQTVPSPELFPPPLIDFYRSAHGR
jgi:cobalamin biosynthesis protein CobD/CbiB